MAVTTGTACTEAVAMALPRKLVTELLELPVEDRGALAALLWRSLEPDDADERGAAQHPERPLAWPVSCGSVPPPSSRTGFAKR